MSPSFFARRIVLCCCLVVVPGILFARAAYTPQAGEYPIVGALPGDQVHPHLSLSPSGGFLVWEDNNTDGAGLGISAVALDSSFSRVLAPFRVNRIAAGDQDRARVALLNGGGAVFVWQGGRPGFQHIYARFLSSSNTWLTGDVLVNSSTSFFQLNPSLAVLTNGNVVIVWGSWNQAGPASLQDIYGQLFSPAGQKLGAEFAVNQFTPFNQRTPGVAALNSGGFVVVWVSEQQRSGPVDNSDPGFLYPVALKPSVEIFARTYDDSASPTRNEFIVNTSFDVCANPVVASGADGGFMVAWGQKDSLNRSNSWDIFARPFSDVVLAGPSRCVNSTLYGDQYAPQISAVGSDYLVLWTSLGQDGSREGVYGQFLQSDGSASGGEFRVNTTTISSQMHPAVGSDNYGRFLTVWTSFVGGIRSFDLFAQRYAAAGIVAPGSGTNYYGPPPPEQFNDDPPPGPGSTNNVPTNSVPGALKLDFPSLPAPGSVLANGFALAKGAYSGLFYEASGVSAASSGCIMATTTERATYSARLWLGNRVYAIAGRFDSLGRATNTIALPGAGSLTVELQLDLSGGDQLRGRVTNGHWSADLLASRLVFDRIAYPAPQAGSYTLTIPGAVASAGSPGGNSVGALRVDSAGKVIWTGTLADGTRVSQISALSRQGISPVYIPLYGGGGCVLSWLQFAAEPVSDLAGPLIWIKSASVTKYYPGGFTNEVMATGLRYTPPLAGTRVLNLINGNGSVVFSGGDFSQPLTNAITLRLNNTIAASGPNKLSLRLTTSLGLFQGSVVNPQTGQPVSFQGALFERANLGLGFFLGPNQSGKVSFAP